MYKETFRSWKLNSFGWWLPEKNVVENISSYCRVEKNKAMRNIAIGRKSNVNGIMNIFSFLFFFGWLSKVNHVKSTSSTSLRIHSALDYPTEADKWKERKKKKKKHTEQIWNSFFFFLFILVSSFPSTTFIRRPFFALILFHLYSEESAITFVQHINTYFFSFVFLFPFCCCCLFFFFSLLFISHFFHFSFFVKQLFISL